jgi:hypothetical protein
VDLRQQNTQVEGTVAGLLLRNTELRVQVGSYYEKHEELKEQNAEIRTAVG